MTYVIAGLCVVLFISLIFNAILYGYNSDLEAVILRQQDRLTKVRDGLEEFQFRIKKLGL